MVQKPLRADAQRNRDAIVAAARTAFATGAHDLRFDDFAPLAGVGTGTLYRHFPTREALAAAVFREEAATLCDRARELGATRPPAEALAAFLREFVAYLDEHHALALTLTVASGSETFSDGGRELEDSVSELVRSAVAAGEVRADADAGAVLMALHGISSAHDRPGWRNEADGMVTLLIDGMTRTGG